MRVSTGEIKKVVIVGAGFSGTLTATRLLQFADSPLEITIIERNEGVRGGGIAFGEASTTWDHMLNIQAGRITLYRERAEDFLEWANHEADRATWPTKWKYHAFGLSCVVPRRIFGQYLTERLHATAAEAREQSTLVERTGAVVDVRPDGEGHLVQFVSGDEGHVETLHSDYVVFATGHLDPVRKPFYDGVAKSDRFLFNPYANSSRAVFGSIAPDETVLLVGSGLTSFDAVVSLVNAGHSGEILICSRAGYLHGTYPADHQHDIWQARRPPFLDADTLTADAVVEGVRSEYLHLKAVLHDVHPDVVAERIMKAWEPYVIELAQRLDPADVRMLLDRYKSLIVASRTSTVPDIGNVVRSRMRGYPGAPRTISQLPAEITGMTVHGDKIRVSFSDRPDLDVDRVVNCLGNTTDYSTVVHPLWRGLVQDRRQARAHGTTGRGVEVRQHGQLVAQDGKVSATLYGVGPMRQGDETCRRGRLGAFVFSIGTLRNQCFDTAMEMLRHMRFPEVSAIPEDVSHCLIRSSGWLVEHLGVPQLKDRVLAHAQESVLPATLAYLQAQDRDQRAKLRKAIANDLSEFGETLDVETVVAQRLTALLALLVEKHVVQSMCDITRLSEWQSPQYTDQVRTTAVELK
ncbi:FAD/NAD(P)-binding protein [Lentzea sp. BCCO 10_0856]|uniref:FAD/NAD(P)-binding protein n=1 Tax=Lentzea miocenica TaxID=3095431 RepID=A0ABU4T381_9PSEU|nr:FAD/NAD(P)-binding protein [Lentzea sp. BCCO 10_0856]MDX8032606.1 FAD/NAD(P)-binding protein [Lentzea sp. BCCO 10_0856]